MVEQLTSPAPVAPVTPAVPAEAADLSAEIARQIEKEPSDRVSCRRVYENYYRCNWWAPAGVKGYDNPAMYGSTLTTHHVRKSAFLHVTKAGHGLTIRVA